GGSGSTEEEISEALDYGSIKMNIDTDTQYAFTRTVASHIFENYDGVLKVDGAVSNKKAYDPRAWGKKTEAGMATRVVEACQNLGPAGAAEAGDSSRAETGPPAQAAGTSRGLPPHGGRPRSS